MIFSLFKRNAFKPKWQHKNSNVRIEAIEHELNNELAEDKDALITLLNNDEVELVRRAALLKLNSFSDYLQASRDNSHKKIKEFAQKQVIKILLGEHSIIATDAEKKQFLSSNPKNSLLEQWLFAEQDVALIKAIYEQIGKPHLLTRLFIHSQNKKIQTYLLEQVNDIVSLEKLSKKNINAEISKSISDKITRLQLDAQKPKLIHKNIQLLLSKLLALKEQSNYETVVTKRQQLSAQWQAQQDDLALLDSDEQKLFIEKYQKINEQLDKIFAVKAEQYQQDQIRLKLLQQQANDKQSFTAELENIDKQLVNVVFADETLDEVKFEQQLTQLQNQIEQSSLGDIDKRQLINKLTQQKQRASQLPQIAQSISDATQLIAKIVQLALPENMADFNERQTIYQDWLKQWRKVEKQSDGLLPESILQAYQEINQRWQQGLKPFINEQQKLFNQVRKMHSDLKRLLNSGKYNACFGLFKKVNRQFALLSPSQQQKLQREHTVIEEKMAELSDWEHYIATPRKQELLTAIQTLAEQPCDDLNEQAKKVKEYRKQWNLLGHADEEIDHDLNENFNTFCEKAFEPCRKFYAHQEEIREQNKQQRLQLIAAARTLSDEFLAQQDNVDWKLLDNQLAKLNKQWKNVGEVERSQYKNLMDNFSQAIAPLKSAIHQQQLNNATSKKQLITQAEALLAGLTQQTLDCKQAIAQTKHLQEKWRSIGYSGERNENKLWQNFRKVNDQIFALRDQDKASQRSLIQEQEEIFTKKLAELEEHYNTISSAASIEQLQALLVSGEELLQEINAQQPVMKKNMVSTEKLMKKLHVSIQQKQNEQTSRQWQRLFELLKLIINQQMVLDDLENNDLFQSLSMRWKKRFIELMSLKIVENRDDKTLELEILAGIDSPVELKAQRMKVQVALMQKQMSSGEQMNVEKVFEQWLLSGKLIENDIRLIERVEAILVKDPADQDQLS